MTSFFVLLCVAVFYVMLGVAKYFVDELEK